MHLKCKTLILKKNSKNGSRHLENVLISDGKEYTEELLRALYTEARLKGIEVSELNNPPFKNTVHSDEEHPYPGNLEYEEKIRHFIRWNSLLTVLNANKDI